MKVSFIEKKVNVSNYLKRYTEEKLAKLDRFFKSESDARVVFSREGNQWVAEITITADTLTVRSKESSADIRNAVGGAVDNIVRKIRKNKTRLEKRLRDKTFDVDSPVYDTGDDVVEEESEFDIVRTKRFEIRSMTAEEAILQMNLLGHTFFVFRNESNNHFSVVYKRSNGGYGIIEED